MTSRVITFVYPFSLKGIDGELPPGSYTLETVEELIANVSFLAYRRVSTAIVLSANGGRSRQVVIIDPQELAAAEAGDTRPVAARSTQSWEIEDSAVALVSNGRRPH
jgi:hypothetical protein